MLRPNCVVSRQQAGAAEPGFEGWTSRTPAIQGGRAGYCTVRRNYGVCSTSIPFIPDALVTVVKKNAVSDTAPPPPTQNKVTLVEA
jgi:hypothetical protein